MNQFANNYFYKDIVSVIIKFLSCREQLNFLSTCKRLRQFESLFYNNKIYYLECALERKDMIANLDFCKKLVKTAVNVTGYQFLKSNYQSFPNLRDITFFGQHLIIDWLPVTVTRLTIESNLETVATLPEGITHLKFGSLFDKPLEKLPKTLKYLYCSQFWNHPLDNLPNGLLYLNTGDLFNNNVDNLPDSIAELVFGMHFNKPIKKLPSNLKKLTFGFSFNQPIDNLPDSITHLTLGQDFNQPIDHLPKSLIHLTWKLKLPGQELACQII